MIKAMVLSIASAILISAGNAGAVAIYFGEDINHTSTGQNENSVRIPHPNADAAHASFVANLQGVATESFESYAANSQISTLTFGPDTATLSPSLQILGIPTGTFNGVYPISGNNTLLQAIGLLNVFQITFSSPQAVFGFYATDIEIPNNSSGSTRLDRKSAVVRC